jgi:ketosteroid isomerase-like protein
MQWKRIALVLITFSLLVVPLAWSQGGNAEQQIKKFTNELRVAQLKADTNTVEQLYADDYAAIRGDGTVQTKAQEIESLKSGALTYDKIDVQDLKIRVYGNTAVVTNLVFSKGITNGKPRNTNVRSTRVWRKERGSWKSVAYQPTRVSQ